MKEVRKPRELRGYIKRNNDKKSTLITLRHPESFIS